MTNIRKMKDPFAIQSYNIFHYTDMNALINIIRGDCILLRATNCLYLNDSNEIVEGAKAIQRVMKKTIVSAAFKSYYLTSFSRVPDQLSMWGMYASNGNGCAIGLDYNTLSRFYLMAIRCTYGECEIDKSLLSFLELNRIGAITQMGPNHEVEQAKINDNIEELRSSMENNLIISNCLGAKHEAYKHEEEVRCVAYISENQYVKFRTKNGIIIPYVEIQVPKEALKSIVIGPTNKSQLSLQSIFHFLSINGYDLDRIELRSSQIPYRG